YGDNYVSVDKMQENGLAFSEAMKQAGFEDGDKIMAVDGKMQSRADWLAIDILLADSIRVERDGKQQTIRLSDGNIKSILNGAMRQGLFSPDVKDVVVDSIIAGGNAEKAGLKRNDQIIAINGNRLNRFSDFKSEL